MQAVFHLIELVKNHPYPVLVLGETGTGKELVARAIHYSGARRSSPFVPVDCTAIAPTLVESELFGYVKGAFTGAEFDRPGLLEAAKGGTLLLDEIGEMPLEMQAKLLRVMQEKEFRPVGSTQRIGFHARVIAATNRHLSAEVRGKRFRMDLYYRLNVVEIKLPPLRERREDIPLLAQSFLKKHRDRDEDMQFSEGALDCLMNYDWPGNVRELENVVERILALGSGPTFGIEDLPHEVRLSAQTQPTATEKSQTLKGLQRHAIFEALEECGGDRVAAARLLGIGKTTLYRWLKRYKEAQSG